MPNKWMTAFACVVIVLFGLLLLNNFFNNGAISFDTFPLRQDWNATLPETIETLSTHENGLVFARTGRRIFAIDGTTGRIVWNHPLNWQAIPHPPIAIDGAVVFADGKGVWSLDVEDGKVLWHQQPSLKEIHVRAASQQVVAVDVSQEIFAYDSKTGNLLWNKPVCRNQVNPHIINNIIYVPCYGIRAINLISGEEEWEIEAASRIVNVGYHDNVMYYSPNLSTISAFNLVDKTQEWERSNSGRGFRQFTFFNQYLGVTDADTFCVFKRESGELDWCKELNNPQNPTLLGDHIYIFNGTHNEITALDLNTGQVTGELRIRKTPFAMVRRQLLVSAEERIYFSNGREIFAFGK